MPEPRRRTSVITLAHLKSTRRTLSKARTDGQGLPVYSLLLVTEAELNNAVAHRDFCYF